MLNADNPFDKSNHQPLSDRQWEIDRYLLDDPTLDRGAFEQQMLADASFAEQVAASVGQMQLLGLAAASAALPAISAVTPCKRLSARPVIPAWAMFTTVATILMAVAYWRNTSDSAADATPVTSEFAASDRQLSQIAEHWLAFENPSVVSQEEDIVSESVDGARRPEQSELEFVDQTDWLLEAAKQFYQENREGSQG